MTPTREEMDMVMRLFFDGKLMIDRCYANPTLLPYAVASIINHTRHDWTEEEGKLLSDGKVEFRFRKTVVGWDVGGRVEPFSVVSLEGLDAYRVTTPAVADDMVENAEETIRSFLNIK